MMGNDAEGLNDQFIAHGLAPAVATNTKDIKTNMKDIANLKQKQKTTSKDIAELQKQEKKTLKDVAELQKEQKETGEDLTILHKDFDHLAAWAESQGYVPRGD